MKELKIGVIGLGCRSKALLEQVILDMADITVAAVCDEYEDRIVEAVQLVQKKKGTAPFGTTDYNELLALEEIEAVFIGVAWETHIDVAIAAMRAGKYTGLEVGGAYSIEDCWRLVRTYEETGVPCMMLENCCYGQKEMMCLNMAKKGILGELVHCSGAYCHDLREEVSFGDENRHYRLRNYIMRNCENYPTHELGPIAKLLNINHGNRMLTLTSVSSKSVGLREYIEQKKGGDSALAKVNFAQGDVVSTIIRCAGGETITLSLDTTLPRPYSRGLTVHGTKGYYEEANNSLFLDCDAKKYAGSEFDWKENWDNAQTRYGEYNHPLWKWYQETGVKGGHDGMDWLVFRAFFESAMKKTDPPIDVYDAAAWMSISALSEQSVAMGGAPVTIPDFTRGKWIKQKAKNQIPKYCLDKIEE